MNQPLLSFNNERDVAFGDPSSSVGPHHVSELLSDVRDSLLPLARPKEIALSVDAPNECEILWCDRDRVFQVLSKLVGRVVGRS